MLAWLKEQGFAPYLIGAAILLGTGWWMRSCSEQPVDPEIKALREQLRATQDDFDEVLLLEQRRQAEEDSARRLRARGDSLRADSLARLRAQHLTLRAEVRGLRQVLAAAPAAPDSIELYQRIDQLQEEALSSAEEGYQLLLEENARLATDTVSYGRQIESLLTERNAALQRAAALQTVADGYAKAKSGCTRFCPTALAVYDAQSRMPAAGLGIRTKVWKLDVTGGVVWHP